MTALPGCWNVIRPEYFYFEGSCRYSRHFTYLPVARGERVFLRVGAANYDAHVFLNKRHLGNHYGGSTPFCVELTAHLAGDNLIQLCVNNVRTLDRVPMRHTDWFNWFGACAKAGHHGTIHDIFTENSSCNSTKSRSRRSGNCPTSRA